MSLWLPVGLTAAPISVPDAGTMAAVLVDTGATVDVEAVGGVLVVLAAVVSVALMVGGGVCAVVVVVVLVLDATQVLALNLRQPAPGFAAVAESTPVAPPTSVANAHNMTRVQGPRARSEYRPSEPFQRRPGFDLAMFFPSR